MPLFKETWQFRSPPAYTWSETYYRVQSGVEALLPVPADLLNARLALLDNQNTFVRVRFTDVKVPRRGTDIPINKKGVSDSPGALPPANAGEAAIIALASTATPAHRRLWLRGMSENSMVRDATTGEWGLLQGFRQAIDAFILELKKGGYLIAVTQKPGAGEILLRQVVSINGAEGNGTSIVKLSGGIGAVKDDWFIVRKGNPKHAPGFSGQFQVLESNAETFEYTVRYRTPGDELLINVPLGEVYKRNYLETAVIDPNASGWLTGGLRQIKNPNSGSRGARRAVRLRGLA